MAEVYSQKSHRTNTSWIILALVVVVALAIIFALAR